MAAPQHVLGPTGEAAPWRFDATELARRFAKGETSPVEFFELCLARIDRLNPRLNAIVTLDADGARAAARASEARWRSGCPLGSLDGVPLSVKDNIPIRGMRATWGSRLFADNVPTIDELPIVRLREAGAVIIGKTNIPEFTLQGYSDNQLFGPTRNPWDLRLTPGGSSGGAVAAVAAGLAPLALGTDGGGSIRRPASHTGLVGLKPSTGRVARCDGFPIILHDFEVIGPIARTTADAALLLAAIAGPDPRDRASLAFQPWTVNLDCDPSPQRILFVPKFGASPVDREIAASVAAAAANLEALGHDVEEGPVPFDLDGLDRIWPIVSQAGLAWLLGRFSDWRGKLGPALAEMAEVGGKLTATDYVEALDVACRVRQSVVRVFTRYDLILTPTAAALPWPATESHPPSIDDQPVGPRGHAVFTAFVNASGCPGINIPCAPAANGLPIGIQLVGRYGAD